MHHQYFPVCPVEGDILPPSQYDGMGARGAIPHKCSECDLMFEGGCRRYIEDLQRYMHLDFGPCGIDGPTDPVVYEDRFITSKVEIPRKCVKCRYLVSDSIYGFTCKKDTEIWGGIYRGLDWGAWAPDRIYVELPSPKITTKVLVDCAYNDDLKGYLVEYRRTNPGISLSEGRQDYSRMREVISGKSNLG